MQCSPVPSPDLLLSRLLVMVTLGLAILYVCWSLFNGVWGEEGQCGPMILAIASWFRALQ
jgi:hypothetical protein